MNAEEAVLRNEPIDNSYIVIDPYKMSLFPYYLLGVIKTHFENGFSTEISEGVGILIGPETVLTSAHNLYMGHKKIPNKIEFSPLINGNYKIFNPILALDYSVPENFIKMKNKEDKDEDVVNFDYGLLHLPYDSGLVVFNTLFQDLTADHNLNLTESRIFKYVENHIKILDNLYDNSKNFQNMKMSMISYTKYNDEYLKVSTFRYKTSFNLLNKKYSKADLKIQKKNHSKILNDATGSLNNLNKCISAPLKYDKNFDLITLCEKSEEKNKSIKNSDDFLLFSVKEKRLHFNQSLFYTNNSTVLCEAKGRLCNFSTSDTDDKVQLKYIITTYGGQSGSPIFLRMKLKNTEEEFAYIFAGIHSRSPKNNTNPYNLPIGMISKIDYDYESDSFSIDKEDNTTLCSKITRHNKTHSHIINESFLGKTGVSDFNIGLRLTTDVLSDIKQMLIKQRTGKLQPILQPISHYQELVTIDFFSGESFVLRGIFHEHCDVLNLFVIAERVVEIPSVFLNFTINEGVYSFDNFNLSNKTKIIDLIGHSISKTRHLNVSFSINLDKYGETIAKKLINKINELDSKLESKIINKERKTINNIVKYIFEEIQFIYAKSIQTHGLLFKIIRDKIINDKIEF